jgi:hypothetical protein
MATSARLRCAVTRARSPSPTPLRRNYLLVERATDGGEAGFRNPWFARALSEVFSARPRTSSQLRARSRRRSRAADGHGEATTIALHRHTVKSGAGDWTENSGVCESLGARSNACLGLVFAWTACLVPGGLRQALEIVAL